MKKLKPCPFCGKEPCYNKKSDMVRCETLDCAINSWWILPEEWNRRAEQPTQNKPRETDHLLKLIERIGLAAAGSVIWALGYLSNKL